MFRPAKPASALRTLAPALLLASVLGSAGCEGATDPTPPVPATVRIAGDSVHLHVGEGAVLPAAALDTQGNPVAGARLVWSSSAPEVAPVDSAGRVTGARPGRAEVTARLEGTSGAGATVAVRVTPRPDRLEIGVDTVAVAAPGPSRSCERPVRATLYDRSGNPVSPPAAIHYSVEDTTIAGVARYSGGTAGITTGYVFGKRPGTTRVIASSNVLSPADGYRDTAVVRVLPGSPARVEIAARPGGSLTSVLSRGDTVHLAGSAVNECGGPVAGPAPTFSSGNASVLEVSPEGRVVAREAGHGYVHAAWGALRDSVSFSVYDHRVLPADTTVFVGDTVTFHASIAFSSGEFQTWPGAAWSTSDPAVARLLGEGAGTTMRVLAAGEGEATVTAQRGGRATARLRVVRRP